MPCETEYATVNTLFTEGMAHATIAGTWFVPTVRNAGIDVGIAPMPVMDDTGLPLAPYSGIQGVHVLKVHATEKKDAISRVLAVMMDPEVSVQLAKVSGCAPAMQSCYEREDVKSDELMSHVRLLTLLPNSGEEHSKHWRMIQLIKVADLEIVAIPSGQKGNLFIMAEEK